MSTYRTTKNTATHHLAEVGHFSNDQEKKGGDGPTKAMFQLQLSTDIYGHMTDLGVVLYRPTSPPAPLNQIKKQCPDIS